MNTAKYKSFQEKDSECVGPSNIAALLRDGWVLLDIRIRRPVPKKDGSFEDVAIYSFAHESENP
jgi:hypothetical protein